MSDTAPEDRHRAALPPEVAARLDRTSPLPPGRAGARARAYDLDLHERRRIDNAVKGRSASTHRNVLADWARWVAWCDLNDSPHLPATPLNVAAYIASAIATPTRNDRAPYSPSTLRRWLHSIAAVHRATGVPDPTADPLVAAVLDATVAGRESTTHTRPLRADTVEQLLRVLPADEWPRLPLRRRDRLIITLGFSAALSPADLVELDTSNLQVRPDDGALLVHASRGDTKALATSDALACPTCAYIEWREMIDIADTDGMRAVRSAYERALADHRLPAHPAHVLPPELQAAESPGRPVLRRIRRGGTVTGGRLTPQVVTAQLRTYAEAAGLDPRAITGLSLKAGGRIHRLLAD